MKPIGSPQYTPQVETGPPKWILLAAAAAILFWLKKGRHI